MIFLKIKNEQKLIEFEQNLNNLGIKTSNFIEPMFNNEITAFACIAEKNYFKKLQLLK